METLIQKRQAKLRIQENSLVLESRHHAALDRSRHFDKCHAARKFTYCNATKAKIIEISLFQASTHLHDDPANGLVVSSKIEKDFGVAHGG